MRILIGTLHSAENEFAECVASIHQQTHQDFEHFIIRGLPEREAHDTLYSTFMARGHEFDLFMKIDADMVLEDANFLSAVVEHFRQLPNDIDVLTIPVFDMYLRQPIIGMHTFRSTVKWPRVTDNLFTDKFSVPKERRIIEEKRFFRKVTHCKNPTPFQAFHFGLHRGVKIVEAKIEGGDIKNWLFRNADHWKAYETVRRNFWECEEVLLGLATLGYELALAGHFKTEHVSYTNPYAAQVFQHYSDWDVPKIKEELRRLYYKNGGWLPSKLRLGFIKCASLFADFSRPRSQATA
jgi:hypothetical protein